MDSTKTQFFLNKLKKKENNSDSSSSRSSPPSMSSSAPDVGAEADATFVTSGAPLGGSGDVAESAFNSSVNGTKGEEETEFGAHVVGWIFLSVVLLIASGVIMVIAWYLHLRYEKTWSIPFATFISWLIAGTEYIFRVPGNRIGFVQGQLTAATLRAIAEVIIILAFLVFNVVIIREPLRVNHILGFSAVIAGVILVLVGPFPKVVLQLPDDRNATMSAEEEADGLERT